MKLFEELINHSATTEELDRYLELNIGRLFSLSIEPYSSLNEEKVAMKHFVATKRSVYCALDFFKGYNKAFISILFDFYERFGFTNIVAIEDILQKNELSIGTRREAAKLFLMNISEPQNYIDRFEEICKLLDTANEYEEDNEKRSLVTFANFYLKVLRDASDLYFNLFRIKLEEQLSQIQFKIFRHKFLVDIFKVKIDNKDEAEQEIQSRIDDYLNASSDLALDPSYFGEDLLIESESDYSNLIEDLVSNGNVSFSSIRSLSVSMSDGQIDTGRGVKILTTEEELRSYMRRFGNMHNAKLNSAFEFLQGRIDSPVNLYDWGCGQALASMAFMDNFGTKNVKSVILIEPSIKSIMRASLHLRCYEPKLPIKTIAKKFNELVPDDFPQRKADVNVHLFSNVLDMDDYDQLGFFDMVDESLSDVNYFVCVSPYIDDVKTDRVDQFKRHFELKYNGSFEMLGSHQTTNSEIDDYWHCNNNYKGYFNSQFCEYGPHKWCGCKKQWTRVIYVFKVNA